MTPNEWSGPVGDIWAQEWQRTDRSFGQLTQRLMAAVIAAAPLAGRAIDIGCGAGETSLALATARPRLDVCGIDISPDLLGVARSRGAGVANLEFLQGDATLAVGQYSPVDLYFSRHGVMFFDDPVAAFARFHATAAPGARLVFSCFRDWQANGFYAALAAAMDLSPPEPNAPGPFAFADSDRTAMILTKAGWHEIRIEPVDFAYRAGAGDDPVSDATSYLSRIGPAARAQREAPEERRRALEGQLRAVMERYCRDDVVDFPAAAWIVSARA